MKYPPAGERMFRKGLALLLFLLIISGVFAIAGQTSSGTSNVSAKADSHDTAIQQESELTNSIMHPDSDTRNKWVELYNAAPRAFIDPNIVLAEGASFSLLPHLQYTPSERSQGWCGDCWVWAGTGVLEIALDVQTGIKDRLSIQYLGSNWHNGGGTSYAYSCCGGWLDDVAYFYSSTGKAIPWSNTNAAYADYSRGCGTSTVAASSISTSPNYPIISCFAQAVNTTQVPRSTAITNIKNVLNQNKAVWFAYYLPTQADWNVFFNYWYQAESVLWSPDYSNGHTWDSGGGGHGVLCVGYDDTDPNNSYWIMVNSWGTAGGLRPNGIFRMNMNINYDCSYNDNGAQYSLYWETLNVNFNSPAKSITITSNPTGSGLVKVDGTTIITPQTYTWTTGSSHSLEALSPTSGGSGVQYVWTSWNDSGGQSHQYTVPSSSQTVIASFATQYYLTVNSPYGSPTGAGWYSSGSSASFSVTSPASGGTGTQYVCTGYSGDATGSGTSGSTTMDRAKTVTFNWKNQYYLTVNTYPSSLDSPSGTGWYDSGASGPAGVSQVSGYNFQYWYLDGQSTSPYSANLATTVMMNAAHTVTAYFKMPSTITLAVSSSSFNLGESTILSGSISPVRVGVSVKLNYSTDGGVSWATFMNVRTDESGAFSTTWSPPYPFTYQVRAYWAGDFDYAGAISSEHTVTVTGDILSQPSLRMSFENRTYRRGETVKVTVTVFNWADTALEGDLYFEVIGLAGDHYDCIPITVEGGSTARYDFSLSIPSNALAGVYRASSGLLPPQLAAYDVKYVKVG